MIKLIYHQDDHYAGEVVYKALVRSFSESQIRRFVCREHDDISDFLDTSAIYILINPDQIVLKKFKPASKVIILGKISTQIAEEIDVILQNNELNYREDSIIRFHSLPDFRFPIDARPLIRYDFPNEWNNLGFGAIRTDGSIWSIAQTAQSPYALATINKTDVYITLRDFEDKTVVWINRPVGLVDSVNWCFIEYLISAYRFSELYSAPYLLDIPANCSAAVTMRLDCDEDILSAKPLFDFYQNERIPFSLAVKTSLPIEKDEKIFLNDIEKNGGAILSHSENHKVSWGENYDDALYEACESKRKLEKKANLSSIRFAVSPFHSNRPYAVRALEEAGYAGFIAGIIAYDPEYLLSRGGLVPFCDSIVSHSQQCMMHGDCLLTEDDPIRVYKKAFDYALDSRTLFGYLDHPFSTRYQYGWKTEDHRIAMHKALIDYIRQTKDVLFMNEADCLRFMMDKSNAMIEFDYAQKSKNASITLLQKHSSFQLGISLNNQVVATC